jgi:hypothetical protein
MNKETFRADMPSINEVILLLLDNAKGYSLHVNVFLEIILNNHHTNNIHNLCSRKVILDKCDQHLLQE